MKNGQRNSATNGLTDHVELGCTSCHAVIILCFAHQFTNIIWKHFTDTQNGSSILQVVNYEIFRWNDFFAIQVPTDHRSWIGFYFDFKPEKYNIKNFIFYFEFELFLWLFSIELSIVIYRDNINNVAIISSQKHR